MLDSGRRVNSTFLRLSVLLERISKSWVVVLALLIFAVFVALVLPVQARKSEQYAGDAGSPDTSFFYTAKDLYETAERYGEAGRRDYVQARFTFDLIWPLVYTLFLCTAISWVTGRVFRVGSLWRRANLVPLFGAMFDFLENLSAALVMIRYPGETPVAAVAAGIFTVVKWVLVGGSFVLLLSGGAVGLWRWAAGRRG
jgi:hypothetical protein